MKSQLLIVCSNLLLFLAQEDEEKQQSRLFEDKPGEPSHRTYDNGPLSISNRNLDESRQGNALDEAEMVRSERDNSHISASRLDMGNEQLTREVKEQTQTWLLKLVDRLF